MNQLKTKIDIIFASAALKVFTWLKQYLFFRCKMPATGAIQCFYKQLEDQSQILEEAKIAKSAMDNNAQERNDNDPVQAPKDEEMN